jgi:hypothetical protein
MMLPNGVAAIGTSRWALFDFGMAPQMLVGAEVLHKEPPRQAGAACSSACSLAVVLVRRYDGCAWMFDCAAHMMHKRVDVGGRHSSSQGSAASLRCAAMGWRLFAHARHV